MCLCAIAASIRHILGSSNISHAAVDRRLEWNVKVTQMELPHIFATVKNTFDTYWEQDVFETFNLNQDISGKALEERRSIRTLRLLKE